jgi:hypothetical protein
MTIKQLLNKIPLLITYYFPRQLRLKRKISTFVKAYRVEITYSLIFISLFYLIINCLWLNDSFFLLSSPVMVKPNKTYCINEKAIAKSQILSIIRNKNKNKVGVYRLVNRINNKSFIGYSENLGERLSYYFSISSKLAHKTVKMTPIVKAIQEYGLINFNVEILTYCNPSELGDKTVYYVQIYHPEYNVQPPTANTILSNISRERKEKSTIKVKVYDCIYNKTVTYPSITAAAQVLPVSANTIARHIRMNERYIITKA